MSAARLALVRQPDEAAKSRPHGNDTAIIASTITTTTVYATVRYNLCKGVPWADWPVYTVNKALAVAGLVLLAVAAHRKFQRRGSAARLMAWAGATTLGHVVLSFALFDPLYFEKLFEAGKLTLAGAASVLTGALAFALLEVGARKSREWREDQVSAAFALLLGLGAVHTSVPSATGWLAPATWPGHLPPLTLLACLPPLFVLTSWLWQKTRRG